MVMYFCFLLFIFQLSDYVSGLTEVHGQVQGNSIVCDNYVIFSEESSNNFGEYLLLLMLFFRNKFCARKQTI